MWWIVLPKLHYGLGLVPDVNTAPPFSVGLSSEDAGVLRLRAVLCDLMDVLTRNLRMVS